MGYRNLLAGKLTWTMVFKKYWGWGRDRERETLATSVTVQTANGRGPNPLVIWQEAKKREGTAAFPSRAWPQPGDVTLPALLGFPAL